MPNRIVYRLLLLCLALLGGSLSTSWVRAAEEDEAPIVTIREAQLLTTFGDAALLRGPGEEATAFVAKGEIFMNYRLEVIEAEGVTFAMEGDSCRLPLQTDGLKEFLKELPEEYQEVMNSIRDAWQADPGDEISAYRFCSVLYEFDPATSLTISHAFLREHPDSEYRPQMEVMKSICLLRVKAYRSAVAYLEAAIANPAPMADEENLGIHMYNLACGYSLLGEKEKALDMLAKGLEIMPFPYEQVVDDPDMLNIKDEPRFRDIVANLPRLEDE